MEDKSLLTDVFEKISANRRKTIGLRMAPMIDMIFLLLIFFLVAAKWRPPEDSLPFKLPLAAAQETRIAAPQPLVIRIFTAQKGCTVQIAGLYTVSIENATIESDLASLMNKMANCLNAQKRFATDPIEIVCQPQVKWEYVAKIYNVFFGAGLTDITFIMTEHPDNDKVGRPRH
jgi:biopolymer transport protein ExbD